MSAYYDMIVQSDRKATSQILYFTRHVDIGAARSGIATRVIMHQNEGRGVELQGPFDNFPWVDGRMIDGASPHYLICDYLIFFIEK